MISLVLVLVLGFVRTTGDHNDLYVRKLSLTMILPEPFIDIRLISCNLTMRLNLLMNKDKGFPLNGEDMKTKKTRFESEQKTRLLDTAVRIFGEKGYQGATIRGLGRAARVNSALLYYYYENKHNLFMESIRMILRGFLDLFGIANGNTRARATGSPSSSKPYLIIIPATPIVCD